MAADAAGIYRQTMPHIYIQTYPTLPSPPECAEGGQLALLLLLARERAIVPVAVRTACAHPCAHIGVMAGFRV
jgi:hypothetical protein